MSSGARGPHSHLDEGTVVAPRPDSDPPMQNSGLEPGSDGASPPAHKESWSSAHHWGMPTSFGGFWKRRVIPMGLCCAHPGSARLAGSMADFALLRLRSSKFLAQSTSSPGYLRVSLQHDRSLRRCLSTLVGAEIPEHTFDLASLPLSLGGLGLLSAQHNRHAANWASWSDSLAMVEQRHPYVAGLMVRSLQGRGTGIHLDGVVGAHQVLVDAGFAAPVWEDLTRGLRPDPTPDEDPSNPEAWVAILGDATTERTVHRCSSLAKIARQLSCHVAVAKWTSCQRSFHVLSHCQAHDFRRADLPCPSPSPLVAPLVLVWPCLPVWPSTRFLWPPPCSMCCGGGAWESWVRFGVGSRTRLS